MADSVYTSRSSIDQQGPLHRRARLESGPEVDMSVRGAVKEMFKLSPERELPLPVDYIVAAAGG